jgi:hypothetical protein
MQIRHLESAMQLLRWTDNRQRMPMEEDLDEPTEAPEDVEQIRAAAPRSHTPKP